MTALTTRMGLAGLAGLFAIWAGAAGAIGPGETAIAARNAQGKLMGEVRILTEQTARTTSFFSCPGAAQRYYVGSYEIGEVQRWQAMGLGTWAEWMDNAGSRHSLCSIDPW